MGLAAATFRLMYLTQFRNDLESKITTITESKMALSKTIQEMISMGNDMDTDSDFVKQLNAKKDRLDALDKKLDMQLELYNSQLKMVDQEIQSATSLRDSSISRSFKYGQ